MPLAELADRCAGDRWRVSLPTSLSAPDAEVTLLLVHTLVASEPSEQKKTIGRAKRMVHTMSSNAGAQELQCRLQLSS
jgi:hypothetical protein